MLDAHRNAVARFIRDLPPNSVRKHLANRAAIPSDRLRQQKGRAVSAARVGNRQIPSDRLRCASLKDLPLLGAFLIRLRWEVTPPVAPRCPRFHCKCACEHGHVKEGVNAQRATNGIGSPKTFARAIAPPRAACAAELWRDVAQPVLAFTAWTMATISLHALALRFSLAPTRASRRLWRMSPVVAGQDVLCRLTLGRPTRELPGRAREQVGGSKRETQGGSA